MIMLKLALYFVSTGCNIISNFLMKKTSFHVFKNASYLSSYFILNKNVDFFFQNYVFNYTNNKTVKLISANLYQLLSLETNFEIYF